VLPIPKFMKRNAAYSRGRNALLSLFSTPRFYDPLSAIRLCLPEYSQTADLESLTKLISKVGEQEGLCIWHTPIGEFATPTCQVLNSRAIAGLIEELFQRNVYLCGPVRIARGSVVLDIGAYVGLFARKAIGLGARHVICVEPVPQNIPALRSNLKSESLANCVSIVAKGIWDKHDVLRMHVHPNDPTSDSFMEVEPRGDTYEIAVNVVPLDSIVKELELPRVDFVKIDVEGAELRALEGARDVLTRDKPQLAVAVEHTSNRLLNADRVRKLVLDINPAYRCIPGPYSLTEWKLSPDILYFK
jgi:FkbM family methyltransferase